MTAVQDRTHDLFMRAALADDDLGYPDAVSFLAADQEWAGATAWEILHAERRAVVVVTADREILLSPRRRNPLLHWIDGLRGSTPVRAQPRTENHERGSESVAMRLGRSLGPVRAMSFS